MRTEADTRGHVPPAQTRFAYAGFWSRTGALAIDLLVTLVWATPFRAAFRAAASDPAVLGPFRASGVVVMVVLWAYFVVTTALTGGTLGKHALRIRVMATGFHRPDWQAVLFREVVGRVIVAASAGIGYLWAAFDPRKQGWHDKIADTFVVRRFTLLEVPDAWADGGRAASAQAQ